MHINLIVLGYSSAYIRNQYFLKTSLTVMVTIVHHLTQDGVLPYDYVSIPVEPFVDGRCDGVERLRRNIYVLS